MKIWTDYTGSSKTFDWFRTLTRCKFSCLSFLWSHLTNNRVYKYIFKSSIQDQMHLCFDRVKRPSSGWMAVTRITHHYYMITNKFENLNALQRKINTRALLPGARPLILKPCGWIQSNIKAYWPFGFKSSINIDVYIFNIFWWLYWHRITQSILDW